MFAAFPAFKGRIEFLLLWICNTQPQKSIQQHIHVRLYLLCLSSLTFAWVAKKQTKERFFNLTALVFFPTGKVFLAPHDQIAHYSFKNTSNLFNMYLAFILIAITSNIVQPIKNKL